MLAPARKNIGRRRDEVLLALLAGATSALAGWGCTSDSNRIDVIENAIADRISRTLNVETESVWCPHDGDIKGGFECIGKVRGEESFIIEVQGTSAGTDKDGLPPWKARGHKNIEMQLARDLRSRLGAEVESIACPKSGDVAKGFECQLTLGGGIETTAAVASGSRPDRFSWTAPELLLPDLIEDRIAADLGAKGDVVTVDCGGEFRKSVADTSFECTISRAEGEPGTARISVLDNAGHVQYHILPSEAEPAKEPTPEPEVKQPEVRKPAESESGRDAGKRRRPPNS